MIPILKPAGQTSLCGRWGIDLSKRRSGRADGKTSRAQKKMDHTVANAPKSEGCRGKNIEAIHWN